MSNSNKVHNEDLDIAEKLRRDNFDQFMTLVRMHLSFVLDLQTVESECPSDKIKLKKWNLVPLTSKKKCKGVMDGAPLTQEGICQAYQLIEFLKKEQNITVEGIFRRTGSLSRQQELRNFLNQGVTLNLDNGRYSVHDCASVLKGFLSELPEPLLTEAHYPAYCQIAELCGIIEKSTYEQRLLSALQLILLLLPSENKLLLKDLLELLHLTASHENKNKMSADSLATLFTPHLLCPRKLAPETLHINSQTLSGIISFMITKSPVLFEVPLNLAVDIRAYYAERERRKMLSPQEYINESVSDNFAANTVFSFVDHERTAKENQSNPTETALAQLYAHIQSLPESSKKRKLVKQFNRQNGHGTPLQVLRSNMLKNKCFGDSIKKHIFSKRLMKMHRKTPLAGKRSSSEENLSNSDKHSISDEYQSCVNCYSPTTSKRRKDAEKSKNNLNKNEVCDTPTNRSSLKRSFSESDLSMDETKNVYVACLTSTPACVPCQACPADVLFTPEDHGRRSMSPITRSTQRMCKAMQETMMTPRSRKPVLLISGTNINKLPVNESQNTHMHSVEEEKESSDDDTFSIKRKKSDGSEKNDKTDENKPEHTETSESLTSTFQEYLYSRSMLTASPTDMSFSSRTDDYNSTELNDLSSSKLSSSLLYCLDGNIPEAAECQSKSPECEHIEEKQPVLKPVHYDEDGKPVVYETSF